jgi:hypothetical protein
MGIPLASCENRSPHSFVELAVLFSRFEKTRRSTDSFRTGITGPGFELRVYVLDCPLSIGDEDGMACVLDSFLEQS